MPAEPKTYRKSKSSIPISIRLDPEIFEIIKRRSSCYPGGISGYGRDRLTYDLTRKHRKSKKGLKKIG